MSEAAGRIREAAGRIREAAGRIREAAGDSELQAMTAAGGLLDGDAGQRALTPRPRFAAAAALLLLSACAGGARETAVQKADPGDLLVRAGQSRVELLAPFQPGVANGLYKGVIRVSQPQTADRLFRVNAVCSMKGEPGWPTYDNLFGDPISDLKQATTPGASPQRWQVFFHFDGKVEANGKLPVEPWMPRLKDNLCRRGDFDDAARRSS